MRYALLMRTNKPETAVQSSEPFSPGTTWIFHHVCGRMKKETMELSNICKFTLHKIEPEPLIQLFGFLPPSTSSSIWSQNTAPSGLGKSLLKERKKERKEEEEEEELPHQLSLGLQALLQLLQFHL